VVSVIPIPMPFFKVEFDLLSAVIALLLGTTIPVFTTHANRTVVIRGAAFKGDALEAALFVIALALCQVPLYLALGLLAEYIKESVNSLMVSYDSSLTVLLIIVLSLAMLLYGSAKSGIFTGFVSVKSITLSKMHQRPSLIVTGLVLLMLPSYPLVLAFILSITFIRMASLYFFFFAWVGNLLSLIAISVFAVRAYRRSAVEVEIESLLKIAGVLMMIAGFLVWFLIA